MTDKDRIRNLEAENRQLQRYLADMNGFLAEALRDKSVALSLLSQSQRDKYFEVVLAKNKGE